MKVMNSPWEVEPGFIAYIYIEILDPTSKSNPGAFGSTFARISLKSTIFDAAIRPLFQGTKLPFSTLGPSPETK